MNVNRSLAAVAVATLLLTGITGVAEAKRGGPSCKSSTSTSTQVRDISGTVVGIKDGMPVYGSGTQSRTKSIVTTVCNGSAKTVVTYSAWR